MRNRAPKTLEERLEYHEERIADKWRTALRRMSPEARYEWLLQYMPEKAAVVYHLTPPDPSPAAPQGPA